jgi:hypothetical protein
MRVAENTIKHPAPIVIAKSLIRFLLIRLLENRSKEPSPTIRGVVDCHS